MIVSYFAATDDELAQLRASRQLDPARHDLPKVDAPRLSPYALVTLDAAVTGFDADTIEDDVIGPPLEVVDDGEQLLWAVRPALAEALDKLAEPRIGPIACEWADTDEMRADGFDATACATLLTALAMLAREAARAGRKLYIWLCV